MSSVGSALGASNPQSLVYRNEPPLFAIALIISLLAWMLLLVGTLGIALIYAGLAFIFYLFVQSAFISYLRGTATQITAEQFPDLHERIRACSTRLGVDPVPDAYLLHGNGVFNAFATRFLGRNFVVLMSDVVDALEPEPESINFYIGHELGHIRRSHLLWGPLLFPASLLPLLGAAYSRARLVPPNLGAAGFAASGSRWVRSVSINEKGMIRVELAFSPLEGKAFALLPSLDSNKRVVWKCVPGEVEPKYLPARCRQP
jgi:Zn-dependent protease with chaperone function